MRGVLIEYDDGGTFSGQNYVFAKTKQGIVGILDFKKGTTMHGTISESGVDINIEGMTRFDEHSFRLHVTSDQGFRLDLLAPSDSPNADEEDNTEQEESPPSNESKDTDYDGHCFGYPRDCLSKTGVGCTTFRGGNGRSYPTGCTVNVHDNLWQECVGNPLACDIYDDMQVCYMMGCEWEFEFGSQNEHDPNASDGSYYVDNDGVDNGGDGKVIKGDQGKDDE